jgi:hypothetical protein
VLWFKAELDDTEELVPRRRGKDSASPHAGEVEGTVEVHDPEAWGFFSGSVDSTSGGSLANGSVHSAVNLAKALLLITLVVSKEISKG